MKLSGDLFRVYFVIVWLWVDHRMDWGQGSRKATMAAHHLGRFFFCSSDNGHEEQRLGYSQHIIVADGTGSLEHSTEEITLHFPDIIALSDGLSFSDHPAFKFYKWKYSIYNFEQQTSVDSSILPYTADLSNYKQGNSLCNMRWQES